MGIGKIGGSSDGHPLSKAEQAEMAKLVRRADEIWVQLHQIMKNPRRQQMLSDIIKLRKAIFGIKSEDLKPTDTKGNLMPSLQLREKQHEELMSELNIKKLKEEYLKICEDIRELQGIKGEPFERGVIEFAFPEKPWEIEIDGSGGLPPGCY